MQHCAGQKVQKGEPAPDVTSPTDKKEAMCEALHLISCLNNTKPKIKQAEASLLRLQRKWPQIFSDLCFYRFDLKVMIIRS